jgi:GLPGLI family protein
MMRKRTVIFGQRINMKRLILSLSLLISLLANAQIKEGKVVYERTMQMRRMGAEADLIPPTRKDNYELLFGNNQSIYQGIPNPDGDGGTMMAPGMMIRMAGMNDVIYYNFTTGKRIDERELFDREFLIEDTVAKLTWKISDETKTILNYLAQKATAQRIGTRWQMSMENGEMKREQVADTSLITAWFTTTIPVPAGPSEYQGSLPGLVLELDLNRGRTVYKAIEISPKVSLSNIKEPKGGKKLTAAEFATEREKLMEEMRKNMPANSNRTFRVN